LTGYAWGMSPAQAVSLKCFGGNDWNMALYKESREGWSQI